MFAVRSICSCCSYGVCCCCFFCQISVIIIIQNNHLYQMGCFFLLRFDLFLLQFFCFKFSVSLNLFYQFQCDSFRLIYEHIWIMNNFVYSFHFFPKKNTSFAYCENNKKKTSHLLLLKKNIYAQLRTNICLT